MSYVVNRNINYTNVCYFRCRFCAFSKGRLSANLRGRPYDLDLAEIARRTREAWDRGATEICLQGGIHPDYTGETYLSICRAVKDAAPEVHVHAFSPLEVWQGARTLDIGLPGFLGRLRAAGLGSLAGYRGRDPRRRGAPGALPGQDRDRRMARSHGDGPSCRPRVDRHHHVRARRRLPELGAAPSAGASAGGAHRGDSPSSCRSRSCTWNRRCIFAAAPRRGPTLREAVLMHAVARLALDPWIVNIQASWVKMGPDGMRMALAAGANDVGGTLMNESITRARREPDSDRRCRRSGSNPSSARPGVRPGNAPPATPTRRRSGGACRSAPPALTEPVYRRARRFERDSSVPLVRSGGRLNRARPRPVRLTGSRTK